MREPSNRNLCRPVLRGEIPQAGRPGIDLSVIDVPPILVGFGSMKAARFEPNILMRKPERDHFISDVTRILPVMRKSRLWKLRCRHPMRERHRTQRGIAD